MWSKGQGGTSNYENEWWCVRCLFFFYLHLEAAKDAWSVLICLCLFFPLFSCFWLSFLVFACICLICLSGPFWALLGLILHWCNDEKFRKNTRSDMKIQKYLSIQVFKYSTSQVVKYSGIQVFKFSSIQIFKYSNIHVFNYNLLLDY